MTFNNVIQYGKIDVIEYLTVEAPLFTQPVISGVFLLGITREKV